MGLNSSGENLEVLGILMIRVTTPGACIYPNGNMQVTIFEVTDQLTSGKKHLKSRACARKLASYG